MDRPDHPVLDDLEALVADIESRQENLRSLEQRLRDQTLLIRSISENDVRQAVAAYAYWHLPMVHAADLASATFPGLGSKKKLLQLASDTAKEITCDRCGRIIRIGTRDQMKRVSSRMTEDSDEQEGCGLVCLHCSEEIEKARIALEEQKRVEAEALLNELQSMPYAEYLKTGYWHQRREKHFVEARERRRANNDECESCGEARNLDVFHWHNSCIGRERFDDLALLCVGCAQALIYGGKLIERALSRTRRG